jgi:hypothetical protein
MAKRQFLGVRDIEVGYDEPTGQKMAQQQKEPLSDERIQVDHPTRQSEDQEGCQHSQAWEPLALQGKSKTPPLSLPPSLPLSLPPSLVPSPLAVIQPELPTQRMADVGGKLAELLLELDNLELQVRLPCFQSPLIKNQIWM